MSNNRPNIGALILVAAAFFVASIAVDLAVVSLASLVSGVSASFRELVGASIIVAAAQSGVSSTT